MASNLNIIYNTNFCAIAAYSKQWCPVSVYKLHLLHYYYKSTLNAQMRIYIQSECNLDDEYNNILIVKIDVLLQ